MFSISEILDISTAGGSGHKICCFVENNDTYCLSDAPVLSANRDKKIVLFRQVPGRSLSEKVTIKHKGQTASKWPEERGQRQEKVHQQRTQQLKNWSLFSVECQHAKTLEKKLHNHFRKENNFHQLFVTGIRDMRWNKWYLGKKWISCAVKYLDIDMSSSRVAHIFIDQRMLINGPQKELHKQLLPVRFAVFGMRRTKERNRIQFL